MILLFAFSGLIMMIQKRQEKTIEPSESPQEPVFEPRRNGKGTFYPWVPVA